MITDWTRRTQSLTTAHATRNGEGWTNSDLEFVSEFGGEVSDAELAIMMKRTLFAIQTIRHAIRAGRTSGSERVAPTPRRERAYDPNDFNWSD